MKLHHIFFLASALLAAACGRAEQSTTPTIGLVESIIADPGCYESTLLRSYAQKSTDGAIAVVGDSTLCATYCRRLLNSDCFDNVDGSHNPDGLLDFSGEMIASYADMANAGFEGFAACGNQQVLREIAVRDFIMAADTACSVAAFDTLRMLAQPRAKIVVMASPFMAECGAFDVDTLVRTTGAQINVIYPALSARKAALKHSQVARIGVITDSTTAASGVYSRLMGSLVDAMSVQAIPSEALESADSTYTPDLLAAYLSSCIAAGASKPLSTIIIDDDRLSVEDAKASLEDIRNNHTEENMMYRSILEKDVQVISLPELVVDECYRTLRERNIFTHKISRPLFRSYITTPVKGLDKSCYATGSSFTEQYRYNRQTADDYMVVNIDENRRHVSDKRN